MAARSLGDGGGGSLGGREGEGESRRRRGEKGAAATGRQRPGGAAARLAGGGVEKRRREPGGGGGSGALGLAAGLEARAGLAAREGSVRWRCHMAAGQWLETARGDVARLDWSGARRRRRQVANQGWSGAECEEEGGWLRLGVGGGSRGLGLPKNGKGVD
nr:glycine-rich cell wall structural protein-like [Aegilops tauschii subsp. strangulata]